MTLVNGLQSDAITELYKCVNGKQTIQDLKLGSPRFANFKTANHGVNHVLLEVDNLRKVPGYLIWNGTTFVFISYNNNDPKLSQAEIDPVSFKITVIKERLTVEELRRVLYDTFDVKEGVNEANVGAALAAMGLDVDALNKLDLDSETGKVLVDGEPIATENDIVIQLENTSDITTHSFTTEEKAKIDLNTKIIFNFSKYGGGYTGTIILIPIRKEVGSYYYLVNTNTYDSDKYSPELAKINPTNEDSLSIVTTAPAGTPLYKHVYGYYGGDCSFISPDATLTASSLIFGYRCDTIGGTGLKLTQDALAVWFERYGSDLVIAFSILSNSAISVHRETYDAAKDSVTEL